MTKNKIYGIAILVSIMAMLLAACGSAEKNTDSAIATAVALTVAAQNAQTSIPTSTPAPIATPTSFTFPTPTRIGSIPSPTNPVPTGDDAACAKASLVGEDTPDGTIMKPGTVFTKTWQIQNDSPCVWTTSYKVAYWDGNVMGGGYVYNLPETVAPGGTLNLSLVLTAPAEEGEYTGKWVLQTPKGVNFGVGQYSQAFWVKIVVSKEDKPATSITAVRLNIVREPSAGCATNVYYRYVTEVDANGPIKITYAFQQSDGNLAWKDTLEFKTAGTQTITGPFWSFRLGSTPGDKWVQFVVLKPYYQEFERQYFSYLCGNTP
jgi:hypothetical protein